MKYSMIPVLLALTALSACDGTEMNFPVIGVDQNGQPAQVMVPESEYSKRLEALVTTANDSVLPALDAREASNDWMVRTFLIGIGVSATIGIGPWKVGAVPQTRIAFTNSSNPTLP